VTERATAGLRRLLTSRWFLPAAALALAALGLLELLLRPGMTDSPLAPVVVVLLCAPVAAARRHPVEAACAEGLVMLLSPSFEGGFPDSTLMAMVALAYSCGAYASRRAGALAVAGLLLASEIGVGFSEDSVVPFILATLAPVWVGRQVRHRRELVSDLAERNRELEAEQDAFARLSVRRERARIARELHDIVAHHLAVIVVQAGAGRMAPGQDNGAAEERFRSIGQAGGHALAEMARLVDILHADNGDAGPGGKLQLLLDQAGAGGLDLHVAPLPLDVRLPAEVEDAAYRVVQEGLTNAMKHAPGAAVHVRLAVRVGTLKVEVRNERHAAPSALAATGSGLGLTGMRERVESLGGDFEAGPETGGGWSLCARLPMSAGVPPALHLEA
jgi:signal transduction histidine kinase